MAPRRYRRPALLAQFPRLFRHQSVNEQWPSDWPVIRQEQLTEYPALATDLSVWHELEPTFRRLDRSAQISQANFLRQNVALIIGSLVATSLGAALTAVGSKVGWLVVTQATFAALLAQLAVIIRLSRARQIHHTDRLKAEWIRSEFYLFLARVGDYSEDDRVAKLRKQVNEIEEAEGTA